MELNTPTQTSDLKISDATELCEGDTLELRYDANARNAGEQVKNLTVLNVEVDDWTDTYTTVHIDTVDNDREYSANLAIELEYKNGEPFTTPEVNGYGYSRNSARDGRQLNNLIGALTLTLTATESVEEPEPAELVTDGGDSKVYETTEDIRDAIHSLEEGDIITVPQYTNALEVEHLGELNGEKNAFVGVRFADPNKRTASSKNIILNKHSGRAYLSAGTTSKGVVTELEVRKPSPVGTLVTEADEDEDEDDDEAPVEDAFGHDELIEPAEFEYVAIGDLEPADEDEAGVIFDESHHILGGSDLTPFEMEMSRLDDDDMAEIDAELEELTRTFEDEYREEVEFVAECIIEEIEDDMGEDFEHVTRNDLPGVADTEIFEALAFHEYTTESDNYLDVIAASPSDPDDHEWAIYADLDAPAGQSARHVLGAMAQAVFRADLIDALRGEF